MAQVRSFPAQRPDILTRRIEIQNGIAKVDHPFVFSFRKETSSLTQDFFDPVLNERHGTSHLRLRLGQDPYFLFASSRSDRLLTQFRGFLFRLLGSILQITEVKIEGEPADSLQYLIKDVDRLIKVVIVHRSATVEIKAVEFEDILLKADILLLDQSTAQILDITTTIAKDQEHCFQFLTRICIARIEAHCFLQLLLSLDVPQFVHQLLSRLTGGLRSLHALLAIEGDIANQIIHIASLEGVDGTRRLANEQQKEREEQHTDSRKGCS